uniref:Prolyl 4-hydroxylase alpha subunit domain-containing protein n=1 Tax=Arion vulgaris TaxID=1028688 RepID=A0A0B7AZG0_9EUPU
MKMSSVRVYFSCSVSIALCLVLFSGVDTATSINDDRFMSDVNLERYYVIEENALSNADVLLRDDYFGTDDEEEEEEEHLQHAPNLTTFRSVIDEAKAVHRLAGPDLKTFLAHPINVYHLFRRLDNGWRKGLELLLQTTPCKKWNLPLIVGRLRYLIENLPGSDELGHVVEYIAKVQNMYEINVKDIVDGRIGGTLALKPLTIAEQFEIVKILHEKDDMRTTLKWLHAINEQLPQLSSAQREGLNFSKTDILNLMASAYYDMRQVSNALEVTEKALELDPTNRIAISNHLFFTNKLAIQMDKSEPSLTRTFSGKQISKYERLCGRKKQRKVTKKKCRLIRVGFMHYKMEPISYKPNIVVFHDVIRNKTSDTLKNYAHETQSDLAWISEETFQSPKFSVDLNLDKLTENSVKQETKILLDQVSTLSSLVNEKPETLQQLQVFNVGLEGIHLKHHWSEMHLYSPPVKKWRKEAGAYFVFLNDVKIGGEIVFPDNNIILHPEKGSVLFYYHSKVSLHSFCPVIGSSLWVAVQPIQEHLRNYCVDDDEWL